MIPEPPNRRRPPSHGIAAGRWLVAALTLAVSLGSGACEARRDESLGGLVVASRGPIAVTNAAGQPESIGEVPSDIRLATASNGRIVAQTADNRFVVSDAPGVGESRSWRPLTLVAPSGRTASGMDLSLDGRVLAIVFGDPDTSGLELVTIDVETGVTTVRSIDVMANGPPSWVGPDTLALEVIRPDQ